MIKSGKSYSYWLARFNRKMSFHFPWVVPLISDRSVWHNGKQPRRIGFGFAFHSLKNWLEIFKPIFKPSNHNRNRVITFDSQTLTMFYS